MRFPRTTALLLMTTALAATAAVSADAATLKGTGTPSAGSYYVLSNVKKACRAH